MDYGWRSMTRFLFGVVLLAAGCGGGLKTKLCGALGEPCCEADVCDPGGRCGSGNTCQACGGASQPCCLGDTACTGQAVCSTDVCLPCGAKGQACCADDTCNDALSCSGGSCVDASSCTNPCNVGASRCTNGGIETCTAVGTCPAWRSTVAVCPGGTSCQVTRTDVAECVETCPGACTPDAVLCTVEGLKRCVAGATCPSLVTETDDPDRPQCVTGGVVGTDIAWESPAPLNTPLAAIAGDLAGSYWVLDRLGNIVHNALGSWEYEVRPTAGKRALALTSCKLGSRLVAAGEGGTIFRRGFGSWTEENVGSTSVTLNAVICDSTNTFAAGSDGKLYFKGSGAWSSVTTGALGPINGLGYLFSQQRIFLVGNAGEIINCDIAGTPSCAPEASGTTANLLAAWGDTFTNAVYAVGTGGTFLERLGSWAPISVMDGPVTDTLSAVHGWYDTGNSRTNVAAVGAAGVYVARPVITFFKNTVAAEDLTGVMMIDADNVFVSSQAGRIWYSDQVSPPPAVAFTTRGGAKPVTKTLHGVASLGPGRLLAVGDDGTRVRRENGAWLSDGLGASTTQPLRAVASRGNAESYAVGGAGTILVRRYGTWSDDAAAVTTKDLYGVAMDAETAWAVGDDGTWLGKVAGSAWASLGQTATTKHLRGVAVRADGAGKAIEVVAVGADCTVLSKEGTMVTAQAVAGCPAGTALLAAAFTASGELYVGGEGGVLFHRTTMGFQREYLGSGTLESVNGLVVQGSSVWALCTSGELYRRTGTTWAPYATDVTTDTLNAGVNDTQDGLFLVGGRGLIWRKP